MPAPSDALVEHLVRSTPLTLGEAQRVVAEVIGFFAEPVPDFVRRRHGELRAVGRGNEEIFAVLGAELAGHRFAAPSLSTRQLRRIVYG